MRSATRPVAGAPGRRRFCLSPTTSVRVRSVSPTKHRTREHEAAVEEVAAHALRRPGGLPDRDVADEVGMRERRVVARHLAAQRRVEREPQPVAGERLVQRGMARGQRQARRVVEHLAALEILEPRPADEHGGVLDAAHAGAPFSPGGAAARDDLQRLLAARLVDHLTVELHRAAALGALERVEDRLRARDLVGPPA